MGSSLDNRLPRTDLAGRCRGNDQAATHIELPDRLAATR